MRFVTQRVSVVLLRRGPTRSGQVYEWPALPAKLRQPIPYPADGPNCLSWGTCQTKDEVRAKLALSKDEVRDAALSEAGTEKK